MNEIRFIHAADLHLDSPFLGMSNVPEEVFEKIYHSTFSAFNKIITEAIRRKVDFILLVGDLFDEERRSLRAQIQLRNGFNRLNNANIQVYISYGNHDFLYGNHYDVNYPENVHVFVSEKVSSFPYRRAGKTIANIYGFSYESRKVTTNKAKEYKIYNDEVPYHIAMLHGSIESNTEHDRYAPFQLSDLKQEPFDYWALGHIHKRSILGEKPYIVYPGNIQGRHRNENGRKGFYEVTIKGTTTELEFVSAEELRFVNLELDISEITGLLALDERIKHELKQFKDNFTLVSILFQTNQSKHKSWEDNQQLDELVELINESNLEMVPWAYIYEYKLNFKRENLNLNELKKDLFLYNLLEKLEQTPLEPQIEIANSNKRLRKIIHRFTEEDKTDIRENAKTYLLNKLKI